MNTDSFSLVICCKVCATLLSINASSQFHSRISASSNAVLQGYRWQSGVLSIPPKFLVSNSGEFPCQMERLLIQKRSLDFIPFALVDKNKPYWMVNEGQKLRMEIFVQIRTVMSVQIGWNRKR